MYGPCQEADHGQDRNPADEITTGVFAQIFIGADTVQVLQMRNWKVPTEGRH